MSAFSEFDNVGECARSLRAVAKIGNVSLRSIARRRSSMIAGLDRFENKLAHGAHALGQGGEIARWGGYRFTRWRAGLLRGSCHALFVASLRRRASGSAPLS